MVSRLQVAAAGAGSGRPSQSERGSNKKTGVISLQVGATGRLAPDQAAAAARLLMAGNSLPGITGVTVAEVGSPLQPHLLRGLSLRHSISRSADGRLHS